MSKEKTLGNVKITKAYFVEIINKLEAQTRKDIKYADSIGDLLRCHAEYYDNGLLLELILTLVKTAFEDNHKHSWIEYYCYELDFGRNSERFGATREDGSSIDLSDAGKLYDFLIE